METPKEFGEKLTAYREAAGNPSYRKLERLAIDVMGTTFAPTSETIRLYHAGTVSPEKAEIMLVQFLANEYGCKVADLSPTVAARVKILRSLLRRSLRWFSGQEPWDGIERRAVGRVAVS